MPATIIVFEGLDSSFKETNAKQLKEYLTNKNYKVEMYSFPNYDSESSYFIKEYLKGSYGQAMEVNPYVASVCYSLDRYDTFKKYIEKDYIEKDFLIFDRYIGSNIIYQGFKTITTKRLLNYIRWIEKLEYDEFGLPKEDLTLFLKLDIEASLNIMKQKNLDDIHEKDRLYQTGVFNYCNRLCKEKEWRVIECSEERNIFSKEVIFEKIINVLKKEGFIDEED